MADWQKPEDCPMCGGYWQVFENGTFCQRCDYRLRTPKDDGLEAAVAALPAPAVGEDPNQEALVCDFVPDPVMRGEAVLWADLEERIMGTEKPLTEALDCFHGGRGNWTEQDADEMGNAILAALEAARDVPAHIGSADASNTESGSGSGRLPEDKT